MRHNKTIKNVHTQGWGAFQLGEYVPNTQEVLGLTPTTT